MTLTTSEHQTIAPCYVSVRSSSILRFSRRRIRCHAVRFFVHPAQYRFSAGFAHLTHRSDQSRLWR